MDEPRFIEIWGKQLINPSYISHIQKFGESGHIGIAIGERNDGPWDLILEPPQAQEFYQFIKSRYSIKTIGEK